MCVHAPKHGVTWLAKALGITHSPPPTHPHTPTHPRMPTHARISLTCPSGHPVIHSPHAPLPPGPTRTPPGVQEWRCVVPQAGQTLNSHTLKP